jgi:hypothetical protein
LCGTTAKGSNKRADSRRRFSAKHDYSISVIGALKNKPNSWQDYFFDEIHNLPGS